MRFQEFYKKYRQSIFLYIYKRTGNREISEDIVADSFLKLFEKWDDLNNQEERGILSWIYKVSGNGAVDYFRKNKNESINFETEDPENVYDEIINKIDMDKDLKDVYKGLNEKNGGLITRISDILQGLRLIYLQTIVNYG